MADDTEVPTTAPWWAKMLVGDVRYASRWLSVQLPIVFGAITELYAQYPGQVLAYLPESWRPHVVALMFLLIAGARVIKQSKGDSNASST